MFNNFRALTSATRKDTISSFRDTDKGVVVIDPICVDDLSVLDILPCHVLPLTYFLKKLQDLKPEGNTNPYWLSYQNIGSYIQLSMLPGQVLLLSSWDLMPYLSLPILGVIVKPLVMWERNVPNKL
jgi:hypothetical protein